MITVVFATHNGAETLPRTLESMEKLKTPDGGWKLIAVDNASTDNTADILVSFLNKLPLQILYQPKRGKNVSLNMAIPYFEGELIVFTDDDVIPMPNWLIAFEQLAATHPNCSVFGGRILPDWPGSPPDKIINAVPLGPAFAIHPQHMENGPVNPGMIWGPNMAVRKRIFDVGFAFNENIGPSTGNYIQGSETELTHRLAKEGYANWFSNDIIVKHQIQKYQLNSRWIFGRAVRYGKGKSYSYKHDSHTNNNFAMLWIFPRWRVWQFVKDIFCLPISWFRQDKEQYFSMIWRIGHNYIILLNLIKNKIK